MFLFRFEGNVGGGQKNAEHGTLAHLAFGPDITAQLLDDAPRYRQPQIGALAFGLNGKEGTKNPLEDVFKNAGPVVGDADGKNYQASFSSRL